jgi:hypothetical protein
MKKGRSAFKILTDDPIRNRSLVMPRRRWRVKYYNIC